MFGQLPAATYGATDADSRAALMELGTAMTAGFDGPKDGFDGEESAIPALYTYLGQFVDHDITFDPMSSLIKRRDPDGLVDFRTPALDLDNVYGRGPDDQPYMYEADGKHPARRRAGERCPRPHTQRRYAPTRVDWRSAQRRE